MVSSVRCAAMAIVGLLALGCPPSYAQAQSEAVFAADMRQRLQTKLADGKVSPDKGETLTARITGGEWDGALVNFHRIYLYCQTASAADCEATKTEFFDRALVKPPSVTAGSLRLIVRDAQYVAYVRGLPSNADGSKIEMIAEQIGDDLWALLASDSAQATALVPESELKKLGMTRAEAWARAERQTREKLPPLPTVEDLGKNAVAFQDHEYLGSLLIDRAAWARIAAAVGPDLFVTAVSDGFVFVGTMPDGPRLDDFRKTVADDCAHQQRCLSPNVYRFREGRWVPAK